MTSMSPSLISHGSTSLYTVVVLLCVELLFSAILL